MEAQSVVLGVWFAAIWFVEAWLPFYDEFGGSLRDKLRHDGRNLTIALLNAAITAGVFALVIPRVAGCSLGGLGLL